MSTIIVKTERGADITFQNAYSLAEGFLKNHDIDFPWEISHFGMPEHLESVTLFENTENLFEAKYLLDKVIVQVEALPIEDHMSYYISTALKFDPTRETWAETQAYEEKLNIPPHVLPFETADQVRVFLKNTLEQLPN